MKSILPLLRSGIVAGILGFTAHPLGAPAAEPARQPHDPAAEEELIPPPLTALEDAPPDLISIALDDVSLEDAVRMFTHISGANIIASPGTLDGRVTVNLQNVAWHPALRSILELHHLSLIEKTPGSGVYSIVPAIPDAPDPTQVVTIFLNHTTVGEVAPTIRSMLVPDATLTTFPSRNTLVIRSTEANLSEIKALIKELDRPGKQVLIETRILELSDDARKAVGIDWSTLGGYEVVLDLQRQFGDDRTRSSTYRERGVQYDYRDQHETRARYYDESGNLLGADQVESATWGSRPGIEGPDIVDAEWREGTPGRSRVSTRSRGEVAEVLTDLMLQRKVTDVMTAVLSPAEFSVVISALQSMDGVSIVSNPKMLVTSGSTNAFFSVGFREPIVEVERQRGTAESPGDVIISRLATGINTDFIRQGYLEEGVDLRVVATVKTEDLIEAAIRPSLRRKIDEKVVGDNRWPILSVKEIDTGFTLRSGQTVAIGGLTETTESKETSRVPLLGRLPLLGRFLFSHEKDMSRQKETIIFVTLSVADPEALERESGIPEDARLIHQRRLLEEARRRQALQAPVAR